MTGPGLARILWACAAWTAPLGSGCAGCAPASEIPRLLGEPRAPAPFRRGQASVRIESTAFHGEFLAVLVVRAEPLAVRMQLFPDLGGKVLDLAADEREQHGEIPAADQRLDHPGGPANRLLEMFATSLLEIHTPIRADRVRCLRRRAGGVIEAELEPRYGASRCVATLVPTDPAADREYEITRRGVSWRVRIAGARRVEIDGRRFRLTAEITGSETPDDLPAELFRLQDR